MLKALKRFWKEFRDHATINRYGCPNPIVLDGDNWKRIWIPDYGWCYTKMKEKLNGTASSQS